MDVQEKRDCYVNSVTSIAKKQEQGGCGSCCCIPLCTSTFYDKNKCKSGIGLFKFPAETSLRRKWLAAISRYRRKGGVDQFKITNATRVCEFHFKPDEIRVSKGIGRKTLLRGSVPFIFKFKQSEENVRKLLPKRLFTTAEKEKSVDGESSVISNADHVVEILSESETELSDAQKDTTNSCEQCSFLWENMKFLEDENNNLQMELQHLRKECTAEREKIKNIEFGKHIYSYESVSMDKHHFKSVLDQNLKFLIVCLHS